MAKRSVVEISLFCTDFYNPNPGGRNCPGKLNDVGPEGGRRYDTRLKCMKCQRIIEISRKELADRLDRAREEAFQPSRRDPS